MDKGYEVDNRMKRFLESGQSVEAAKRVSMAYLLYTQAMLYCDQANDIYHKAGFLKFDVNMVSRDLDRAFERYHNSLKRLLDNDASLEFCNDSDIFGTVCDRFMNVDYKRINDDGTRSTGAYLCRVSCGENWDNMLLKWTAEDRTWRYLFLDGNRWISRVVPTEWTIEEVLRRE